MNAYPTIKKLWKQSLGVDVIEAAVVFVLLFAADVLVVTVVIFFSSLVNTAFCFAEILATFKIDHKFCNMEGSSCKLSLCCLGFHCLLFQFFSLSLSVFLLCLPFFFLSFFCSPSLPFPLLSLFLTSIHSFSQSLIS